MKRNSLMKRFAAGVLAFSLIIPAVPVGAHTSYDPYDPKTDGVKIITTRINQSEILNNDIKIDTSGEQTKITTKTNVKFYLDCTVDCDWSSSDGLKIDSDTGLVTIPADKTAKVYHVTAKAKNIKTNTGEDEDTCLITVTNNIALADSIKVLPSLNSQIKVTDDGKGTNGKPSYLVSIDGKVEDEPINVEVVPSYIYDTTTTLSVTGTNAFSVNSNKITTLDKLAKSDGKEKITAKIGTVSDNSEVPFPNINVEITKKDIKSHWETNDKEITVEDETQCNIAADKTVEMYLKNNSIQTLPEVEVVGHSWAVDKSGSFSDDYVVKNGNSEAGKVFVYGEDGNRTKQLAATVTYSTEDKGVEREENEEDPINYKIGKVTVVTEKNAKDLDVPEIQLTPTIKYTSNNSTVQDIPATALKLKLGKNNPATVDSIEYNFERIDYKLDKDYSVRDEQIGGKMQPV